MSNKPPPAATGANGKAVANIARPAPLTVTCSEGADGPVVKAGVERSTLHLATGSMSEPFSEVLVAETFGCIWVPASEPDGAPKRIAAAHAALAAFKPTDEIEGMLAAQAVALHFGAMECLRRALLPDQHPDLASKLRKDGANLARAMTDMLDALDRKRGKGGEQRFRVEHVHIHGGQNVVGNVATESRGGRGEQPGMPGEPRDPRQLAHTTGDGVDLAALLGEDQAKDLVPVPGDAERPVLPARRRQHGTADG